MSSQNILDDYVLQSVFADDHDVSEHTVARYRSEPNGLPYAVFGGKIYIHLPGAKEWMAKRIRRRASLRARRCLSSAAAFPFTTSSASSNDAIDELEAIEPPSLVAGVLDTIRFARDELAKHQAAERAAAPVPGAAEGVETEVESAPIEGSAAPGARAARCAARAASQASKGDEVA